MRPVRSVVRWCLVAVLVLPAIASAQVAPSGRESSPPLRLPAALYDVVGAWDLGWGDAPGRGRPAARTAQASATVVVEPNGNTRRVPAAPVGQQALSQFIIRADSVTYRRGSDWAEFATADITSIEEVRWPERNRRSWVKVTWVVRGVEHTMHFQQANASSQSTLLATFRRAAELSRARVETPRG